MWKRKEGFCIIATKKLKSSHSYSTNIHCTSLFNKYSNWHDNQQNLCLAKFVAHYNVNTF
jgi:hypothetical protein